MRFSSLPLTLAVSLAACAAKAPARLPVAVLLRGPAAETAQIKGALGAEEGRGVEIRYVDLPAGVTAAAPADDIEERLAAARRAYTVPDVPACLERLGGDARVPGLLAEGRRSTAARVLFWRVACQVAAGAMPDARRTADEMAAYALEMPAEVEAASPEAEAVVGRALAEVSARPAARLRITSSAPGASVSLDGRAALCVTPCRIDARPGPHVIVATLDGYDPERRTVVAGEGDVAVDIASSKAAPDLAASQWTARYGAGADIDSPGSLRLLALAVRARSLALIAAGEGSPGVRLRGVLSVGGETRARAERMLGGPAEVGAATGPLFDELLREGKLIEPTPLWKRPLFWVLVGGAALTAAAVTYGVLYKAPVTTEVRF